MRTLALVGPDGAGKSTIAREVVRALPVPARHLYMGVNLESSGRMLPTTRLVLALKRSRRLRSPGEAARRTAGSAGHGAAGGGARKVLNDGYSALRLLAWLAEEWYRALIARSYTRRGYVVVFDRHFLYDYYASHVMRRPGQSLVARLHGQVLRRWYPRPDFVVCLDAPAEVLFARKREHDVAALERRRQEYLALARIVSDFAVIDATQPMSEVVAQITGMVEARLARDAETSAGRRSSAV